MVIVLYMETAVKPVKVSNNYYTYRGVLIRKSQKLGFVAVGHPQSGPWFNVGMGTLAHCVNEINEMISNGWTVEKKNLYFPKAK